MSRKPDPPNRPVIPAMKRCVVCGRRFWSVTRTARFGRRQPIVSKMRPTAVGRRDDCLEAEGTGRPLSRKFSVRFFLFRFQESLRFLWNKTVLHGCHSGSEDAPTGDGRMGFACHDRAPITQLPAKWVREKRRYPMTFTIREFWGDRILDL